MARFKVTEYFQRSAIDITKTKQSTKQHDEESTEKTITPPPNQMSNENRRKGKALNLIISLGDYSIRARITIMISKTTERLKRQGMKKQKAFYT